MFLSKLRRLKVPSLEEYVEISSQSTKHGRKTVTPSFLTHFTWCLIDLVIFSAKTFCATCLSNFVFESVLVELREAVAICYGKTASFSSWLSENENENDNVCLDTTEKPHVRSVQD